MNDFDRIYERLLMLECPPTEEAEKRVKKCHEKIKRNKESNDCQECWKDALKGIVEYLQLKELEVKYFSFDAINGDFDLHKTEEEANKEAENALDFYRDNASEDGWPDGIVHSIGYGKLIGLCQTEWTRKKEDFTEDEWDDFGYHENFDIVSDYEIKSID